MTEEEKDDARSFCWRDVSKDRLDVAFRPSGEKLIVPNDRRWVTPLVRTITRLKPECVVLEPRGGFEMKLLERLSEEEAPIAMVNARNVREFAWASGRLAKTDAIDGRCSRTLLR